MTMMNGNHVDIKRAPVRPVLLSVSYPCVIMFTTSIQVVGLVISYVLGLSLHYKRLIRGENYCTATYDFWPSVSAVLGDFLPERYVGRMTMALISFPRIMDCVFYHQFFATRRPMLHQKLWYRRLNRFNSFFLIVQLLLYYSCLYISSKEHEKIHSCAWVMFLIFSPAHMVTFLIIFRCGSRKPLTKKERGSLMLRAAFLSIHVVAIVMFFYYAILGLYCQVYAVSIAAICESIIIVSNLAFHTVGLLDFHSLKLHFCMHWNKDFKES